MEVAQLISYPSAIALFILFLMLNWLYKYGLAPYMKVVRKMQELKGKYVVFQFPFIPYGLSYMKCFITDLKKHGDSFYSRRHDFSKVDVTVGTIRDHLLVQFVNEALILQFYEKQKEFYYIKTNSGVNFKSLKQFLGNGLLLSQNDEWKYKRKIMSSIFNYELIKTKFSAIVEIISGLMEKERLKAKNGKISIDINKFLQQCFGNVVIKCFFGNCEFGMIENVQVFEFLYNLTNKIGSRNVRLSSFLFGSFLMKYGIREIDREINRDINLFRQHTKKIIYQIVQNVNNSASSDNEGLIAKLIRENKLVDECTYQQKVKKGVYTYLDLINQLMTFFFAGTDTTASVMSSLIHKLSQTKNVQQKLRGQIQSVLHNDINNLSLDSLKKMNYLRYCISQMLRIAPPVPFLIMREAVKDHMIGGIKIEKGTYVNIQIMALHHKQQDFQNPEEFYPQRWEKLQNMPDIYKYYYPFSLGTRVCIGQLLALAQSKVALIALLLNFKKGKQTQPARLLYNITYGPEKALMEFETN